MRPLRFWARSVPWQWEPSRHSRVEEWLREHLPAGPARWQGAWGATDRLGGPQIQDTRCSSTGCIVGCGLREEQRRVGDALC